MFNKMLVNLVCAATLALLAACGSTPPQSAGSILTPAQGVQVVGPAATVVAAAPTAPQPCPASYTSYGPVLKPTLYGGDAHCVARSFGINLDSLLRIECGGHMPQSGQSWGRPCFEDDRSYSIGFLWYKPGVDPIVSAILPSLTKYDVAVTGINGNGSYSNLRCDPVSPPTAIAGSAREHCTVLLDGFYHRAFDTLTLQAHDGLNVMVYVRPVSAYSVNEAQVIDIANKVFDNLKVKEGTKISQN